MKKAFMIIAVVATLAMTTGCKQQKTNDADDNDSTATTEQKSAEVKDSTVYGTFVDGGQSAFMLKCDDDSVREFIIDPENDSTAVVGGMTVGDQMAVISSTNEFGERIATRVINLTTLQARWTSLDKNFEIEKGGTVQSHQQGEKKPWTSWRILNGQLVLNTDTFTIDRLDGDSLYLENNEGIFTYARGK